MEEDQFLSGFLFAIDLVKHVIREDLTRDLHTFESDLDEEIEAYFQDR